MMKNVVLKKFLKNTIFRVFDVINIIVPKDDSKILLYSANKGLAFNLIPLRDYLIKNGYNQKYHLFYGIENMKYADNVGYNETFLNQIQSIFVFFTCKHVFYTAGQIPIRPSKRQCSILLDHGACTLKTLGCLTKINNGAENYFTYVTYPNEIYRDIVVKGYNCTADSVVINGEPMTDVMLNNEENYDLGNYSKVILWTPTFRQSDYLGYDDSSISELLPLFMDNDYDELNSFLAYKNMKIIVKLHPMQNIKQISKTCFSNLEILDHISFIKKGFDLYRLMGQVDCMLGDYSSTMLQFLLLDKPLGYVVPDVEEYKLKRGFVFEDYNKFMPGSIIKNKNQFFDFLNDISMGVDKYVKERETVVELVHKYKDGNNCKRALELSNIFLDGDCR